jgi:hypothetical protein
MTMLTCKRLRTAVILSALLFVIGLALEVLAQTLILAVPTSHLALLFVLVAIAVLLVTFLASLLPGTAERLRECQH